MKVCPVGLVWQSPVCPSDSLVTLSALGTCCLVCRWFSQGLLVLRFLHSDLWGNVQKFSVRLQKNLQNPQSFRSLNDSQIRFINLKMSPESNITDECGQVKLSSGWVLLALPHQHQVRLRITPPQCCNEHSPSKYKVRRKNNTSLGLVSGRTTFASANDGIYFCPCNFLKQLDNPTCFTGWLIRSVMVWKQTESEIWSQALFF